MKILISSGLLKHKLNGIGERIQSVTYQKTDIGSTIFFGSTSHEFEIQEPGITVQSKPGFLPKVKFDQENARWDWVKKVVNQIDECPIILDISENKCSIILDF